MQAPAPTRFAIRAIELYERPVVLRLPFRFGMVTLERAPQAFVRAQIRLADGRQAWGAAAEMMVPKWFEKDPARSNEADVEALRASLRGAAGAYRDGEARSAHAHSMAHYPALGARGLEAGFGAALLDKAVADALCRALGVSFFDAVRRNLFGIGPDAAIGDLAGFDWAAFLARLRPAPTIDARHTVGLVDPVTAADVTTRVGDGLPETLEEVVAAYGHRWFKLKVGGDLAADIERLCAIAAVLDRIPGGYRATLDGNEQYSDVEGVVALWRKVLETPALAKLAAAVAFIEQPVKRAAALAADCRALADLKPVIIDESDGTLEAFPRARALGYTGVSSKTCKGFYKSIVNAARCALWNRQAAGAPYFLSAEDLTIQAGLALQQDLALVALLGIGHVERNGHHYVNGMAALPPTEQASFLAAHPDLYARSRGAVRVAIRDGRLALGSLGCAGYACGAEPDWSSMQPLPAEAPEGASVS
ncbi:MAG: enolase C-terminal domain-like protein [Burkholderiales bacterium]|nr:enolase C-terminal domain-like protein [Burkholderiales bacterium]